MSALRKAVTVFRVCASAIALVAAGRNFVKAIRELRQGDRARKYYVDLDGLPPEKVDDLLAEVGHNLRRGKRVKYR